MLIEIIVIFVGLIFSYFLKDINFLSLQFEFLKTGSIYPDFLLIFLIYFSLKTNEMWGIWLGFFAGLLEDSTILKFTQQNSEYINLIGIHTLIYPILGFILGKINRYLDIDNIRTIVFVTFLCSLTSRLIIWFIMGIVDEFYQSYAFIAPSIYTSILAPVWFFFLKWIYHKDEL
ncbi:MAG: rod shape-determining protein MreD [Candidatus Sericytochromatia bacterium]|nr:MAG: rod shape-determining protein MreD [Candidatus Sericytochromatia bacterium]